jgi:AraC family transcriptional regulator
VPEVRIAEFPATRVAVLTYHGPAPGIAEAVQRFIQWRQAADLPPDRAATFTVLHARPAGDIHYDLCAATDASIEPNPQGVMEGVIPAARCAVVRLEDGDTALGATLEWLSREWLPTSGEIAADRPPVAHRITFRQGTEAGMVTDLYLPLF